jgi:hypothetical protein
MVLQLEKCSKYPAYCVPQSKLPVKYYFVKKDIPKMAPFEVTAQITKLKSARSLATGITEYGAELFEQLNKEIELRVSFC